LTISHSETFFNVKSWNIPRKDYGAKFSSAVPDCITRGVATNCCLEGPDWVLGNTFSPGGQCSTGTTHLGRLRRLSLWRFSSTLDRDTADLIQCWRQPCFKQELGQGKRFLLINISMTQCIIFLAV